MKRTMHLIVLVFIMQLVVGCMPTMTTKLSAFPKMYEEEPLSILILPPINETTAAEAKEYYSTTIQEPLACSGFYTFPYQITVDILKSEGVYDSELLADLPVGKFREYFGADAVLFTTIKQWNLSYLVISSKLTVSIDCILRSTKTNEELWKYNGTVIVDLSGDNNLGGWAGLLQQVVETAVKTAVADYVPYARTANYRALASIPRGQYHSEHNADQSKEIVDQIATASAQDSSFKQMESTEESGPFKRADSSKTESP